MGFRMRTCRHSKESSPIKTLFCKLILSKLEYASVIWSRHTKKYIQVIENCEWKFLAFLVYKEDSRYPPRGFDHDNLMVRFRVWSLKDKHNFVTILFLFKKVTHIYDCPQLLKMKPYSVSQYNAQNISLFYLMSDMKNTSLCNICKYIHDMFKNSTKRELELFSLVRPCNANRPFYLPQS